MVIDIIKKVNKQHKLRFNEQKHEYHLGKTELQSVTTHLQTYFPFDKEKISKAVAKKTGQTPKKILQQWNKQTKHGTHIHNLIEQHLTKQNLTSKQKEEIKQAIQFFKENKQYEIITVETRIFSKKHKLAGTVDLILKNKENQKLYLADWKTSKKPIQKNKAYKKAKKPFNYLPNNKFHKFSMQLSLYQVMLKHQYNIQIYDTILLHIPQTQPYNIIQPLTLTYEANQILQNQK